MRAADDGPPGVDRDEFRNGLGAFATGVTIITTRGEDHPYAMTATAVCAVSLDPPLLLVCVNRLGRGAREIARDGAFVVNILAADQEHLSRHFASRDRPRGPEALREVAHHLAPNGSPVLDGVAGYLECVLRASHEAGDHVIFVGEVVRLAVDRTAGPLLVHHSRYRRLA
jgi:3-hydroxy-9,10-secoandrosta-1,3,5(10)-triene-9,17-dione monooxygenase reductase component